MKRSLIIAKSEFLALVQTKFFIIGILMAPVLIGASIAFQIFAATRVDAVERRFAVLDHTGALYATLARAAETRNAEMGTGDAQKGPHFVPEAVDVAGRGIDDVRLELSARVKRKALFAFVEIPAAIFDVERRESIAYYTDTPSFSPLPNWLQSTLGRQVTERRLQDAGIDAARVEQLNRRPEVSTLGLVERSAAGEVEPAKRVDRLVTFVLPFGLMYLLFISVMVGAPQLLNAVIEEKTSKISEVLIASVTPVQLMMGKLLGTGAISAVLGLVYLLGGVYALLSTGRIDLLDPALIAWFMLFLVCTVLMFGAVFLSIGAAASDIKDAQGMMQPIIFLVILPVIASTVVIQNPDSGLAVGASLFPTSAPFIMLIRLAMKPGPPVWQVLLSVVSMVGTTALFVWAAGRIFRVGLLMQGKTPTLAEMIKWIRA
jgi:ABC-2 type transport system permease protein